MESEILDKTQFEDNMTLKEHYNLDEQTAAKVAERLSDVTSGVPRLLRDAFVRCKTYLELLEYDGRFDINNYIEIHSHFKSFREDIQQLLRDAAEVQVPVDLSARFQDDERSIPREITANNALIAWEGTLEKATLLPNRKVRKQGNFSVHMLQFSESTLNC